MLDPLCHMGREVFEPLNYWTHYMTLTFELTMTLTLDFQGQIWKKLCISGMGGSIDMERNGCQLIVSPRSSFDLDLRFRSHFF